MEEGKETLINLAKTANEDMTREELVNIAILLFNALNN